MVNATVAATPEQYIAQLEEPRRSQIQAVYDLVRETVPGLEPFMIAGKIGFGRFRYKGKSKGCEGEWFKLGLASNKNSIMFASCAPGNDGKSLVEVYADRLPKGSVGKSCINYRKFEDVDFGLVREIAKQTESADFSHWVS